MRDIKFRAWYNGAWYEFSLEGFIKGYAVDLTAYKWWRRCTGLKDKNGVEIYEGDVLQRSEAYSIEPIEVFWSERRSAFMIRNISRTWSEYMTDRDLLIYKVIGNIYENPELLEQS